MLPISNKRGKSKGPVSKLFSRATLDENMRGFTLIEVLLAAMILVVAIGAGVAVEKGSIKSGVLTRHRTQAVGLAQEGQNLVRSIRDSSILLPCWKAGQIIMTIREYLKTLPFPYIQKVVGRPNGKTDYIPPIFIPIN